MKNKSLNELSHSYWSERNEEFSGLRMAEYETDMREKVREFIKSLLPKKDKIRALDVGCGAGFLSILLCELGCEVTAVDFSDAMLEMADKNLKEKGFEGKARLQVMDAQNLTFEDNSFDFVITRNVTWILPDAESAYKGMFRVLDNGGVLINMDANYGKLFNAAEERGETPKHPTQTLEQLKVRNFIARDLDITKANRPIWDINLLIEMGSSEVRCITDLTNYIDVDGLSGPNISTLARKRGVMFGVIAVK